MRARLLVYGIVVIKQILTWFVLYRFAGYNNVTLNATQTVTLLPGIVLVMIYRLGWWRIGLAARELDEGATMVAVAHVVLFCALLTFRAMGSGWPPSYTPRLATRCFRPSPAARSERKKSTTSAIICSFSSWPIPW